MPGYIDGFVLPLKKTKVATYRRIAEKAGKIWREHGALDYMECIGDDLKVAGMKPFPELANAKKGETVVFSWIRYRSKAHRDKVIAKAMKDPRLAAMMADGGCPFDPTRMAYGGFTVLVGR